MKLEENECHLISALRYFTSMYRIFLLIMISVKPLLHFMKKNTPYSDIKFRCIRSNSVHSIYHIQLSLSISLSLMHLQHTCTEREFYLFQTLFPLLITFWMQSCTFIFIILKNFMDTNIVQMSSHFPTKQEE